MIRNFARPDYRELEDNLASFDPRDLRNAFGTFLTGVTVVTSREASGVPRGFTANSFTSVSLDPPLLLICVDNAAESFDVFTGQPGFAINVLTEDQVDISGLFASKRADKFDVAQWHDSQCGYPILEDVCAWFDCKRKEVIDAGDHVIIMGEIVDYHYNDSIGLGYVRGGYLRLGLERSAAKAAGGNADVIVGAVVERNGKLMLLRDSRSGEAYVPASGRDGNPGSVGKLQAGLRELGYDDVVMSSLFAVFENEETGQQSIYYRAHTEKELDDGLFIAFDDVPWDNVSPGAPTTMLRRYISEASRQRFGVYFGNEKIGSVTTLSK